MSDIAIITGAGGLVGSEASRFFVEKGFDVVGIDNNMRMNFFGVGAETSTNARNLIEQLAPKFTLFKYDIGNVKDINEIFWKYEKDIKIVVHTAAQPSHDWATCNPKMDFDINATGTLNILELTRKYCPKASFIFTSTNKVYGDRINEMEYEETDTRWIPMQFHPWYDGVPELMPIDQTTHSIFGASKVAADIMVQEYGRYFGMNTVCFRGGCLTGPQHMGAEQHGFLSYLIKCVCTNKVYNIYGYKGKQVRDNIHAYDLVNAFWHYHNSPIPGAVYNMGGGPSRSISILEALNKAKELTGLEYNINYINEPRKGDHRWWVTDINKFRLDYPTWDYKYSLDDIFGQIVAANMEDINANQRGTRQ